MLALPVEALVDNEPIASSGEKRLGAQLAFWGVWLAALAALVWAVVVGLQTPIA